MWNSCSRRDSLLEEVERIELQTQNDGMFWWASACWRGCFMMASSGFFDAV